MLAVASLGSGGCATRNHRWQGYQAPGGGNSGSWGQRPAQSYPAPGPGSPYPGAVPAAPRPVAPAPAPLVHIIFTSVLLGPTKYNGCQWDGITCGAGGGAQAAGQVSAALASTNPYVAVGMVFAGPAASALEKPDAAGTADLYVHGQVSSIRLDKRQDSFTPDWDARWSGVVLDPSIRLRVRLVDVDLQHSDDIDSFDLSYADLVRAYTQQVTIQVRVAEQTHNQVLFAGISVVAAR